MVVLVAARRSTSSRTGVAFAFKPIQAAVDPVAAAVGSLVATIGEIDTLRRTNDELPRRER